MEPKRCYGCMKLKQNSPICEHCGYDERRANGPHQLPVGTILQGKYLVGRVLGQGGFGITYLGRDIKLDIPVAIKEYYPTGMVSRESSVDCAVTVATDGEDTRFAENRDRFLREAQTLARLEDVSEVVQVKNFFEENNTAYIVMGYVRGITLKEHMRRSGGKLPAREVFRLLEPLMEALGQVHELGLVHRDISPDNIMLQPNGRARLIDFGAAHAATAAGDKSTQAVLKHGFAPPEQYQSKGILGPWTDVYAMCATVYHLLTGLQPPNITDLLMGEADFEWEALQGLTAGQLAALKQGLALQYKDRFQTMEQLCAKLFDREEPVPQSAPMPEPIPRPRPQPVPAPKPVPQPEPKSAPKPQPRQEEPSVSETGTIALVREQSNDVPAIHTAPVDNKQSIHTAPVLRQESYTAPAVRKQPAEENKQSQIAPEEPEQQQKKKPWIWGAAAAILLVLLFATSLMSLMPKKIPNGSRVLMMVSDLRQSAFQTGVDRKDVLSITFLNTEEAPGKAVDVSQKGDGSVVAWTEAGAGGYDLYLAAKGPIILPQYCNYMFAEFSALTELDMSGLDTGNVTDMSGMFCNCSNLTGLDVSGFDTGNVTSMSSMFSGCSKLTGLDLSGFDTGKVISMGGMFYGCSNLTELDVSGFDTGNVTYMISMFFGTDKLKNVKGNFDVRNVKQYSYFMDSGDTFNGRPWKELFR